MNTNLNEKINENLNAELDMEQLEDVNGGMILGPAIFLGLTAVGVYVGYKAGRKAAKC